MLSYRAHVVSGFFDQKEEPCTRDSRLSSAAAAKLRDWWWREATAGLPRRSRFDILEHFDAAPDLFLVEVLADGSFRTRIVGERAKTRVEAGRAGSVIGRDSLRKFMQVLWRHYTNVVALQAPVACTGHVQYAGRPSCLYEGLDCPLTADGTGITHIVGILTMPG